MRSDKDYLKGLIRKEGKAVWIYHSALDSSGDDYDTDRGESEQTLLVPIPVKCIVVSVSAEKLIWKFQGIKTGQGETLIMPKRFLNSIRNSYKIVYNDNEYYGYKDNTNQLQVQILDDSYIRVDIARVK